MPLTDEGEGAEISPIDRSPCSICTESYQWNHSHGFCHYCEETISGRMVLTLFPMDVSLLISEYKINRRLRDTTIRF